MDKHEWEAGMKIFLNGEPKFILSVDPRTTLLQYLRSEGLTGTKLGCGEGGCGACTVIVSSSPDHHHSVNACLMPLCSLDGRSVTTIEGLGSSTTGLHPIQERLASMHGSQCGFCTPGIVMSMCAQMKSNPNSTPHDLEDSLDGNLCRCTGYRPILDSIKSLSRNKGCVDNECSYVEQAVYNSDGEMMIHNSTEKNVLLGCSAPELAVYNELHPIFPEKLKDYKPRPLLFSYGDIKWFQPVTLESLLLLKDSYHAARLVVGNTEIGIETKFKGLEYSVFINPANIPELLVTSVEDYGVRIGGSVTISNFRDFIKSLETTKDLKVSRLRGLSGIYHMLSWFASNQIRNAACIAGNIVTASPISDLNPMLLACGAKLRVRSVQGTRDIDSSSFFKAYRTVDLHPNEILESIFIPFTQEFEFVVPFKQARRREDDISIVTSGIRFLLAPEGSSWIIRDAAVAFGGLAPTTILASSTTTALLGKPFDASTVEAAYRVAAEELKLPEAVPGGQPEYRTVLAASFIFKSYFIVLDALRTYLETLVSEVVYPSLPMIDDGDKSALSSFVTSPKQDSRGEQSYSMRKGGLVKFHPVPHTPDISGERDIVGSSVMHKSAILQVTGEAVYTDDIKLPTNAVHAALVTSSRAHAKILSIDCSLAEKCDGFVAYLGHKDIVGSNHIGAVVKDEEVFAEEEVKHVGAVIGIVIANTHEQAMYAAKKVIVSYEDLPAIISIDDAIAAGSFFECFPPKDPKSEEHEIANATDGAFDTADIVVEGTAQIGGQEHFYLETNCTVVIPTEAGSLEIISSTQNPTKTQKFCAYVCGLPSSRVVAKCKRMGGGFGGKETRSVFIACAAALAAQKLNRPVSINIERDVDMSITGQRHAFRFDYRAGCDRTGKLKFLDAKLYSNAGFSLDLSQAVMDRALFHSDNVYKWPALRVRGKVCKTNQPSHTAFRGFGGPQGMMLTEFVMDHLSHASGIDSIQLRQSNFYVDGDKTHFGQTLEGFYVDRLWTNLIAKADYIARRSSVEEFNAKNSYKKRGLAIIPTKFGINFTAKFMNQGGALVHVYTDGTALVSHGGTEMGQGLHTKMIQVAAQCFGIPHSDVHIADTSTNVVANSSPTAASMSTDLYGMAVLDACEQILKRLEPVRTQLPPEASWQLLVETAFYQRVDLSAHGYYVVDGDRCGYNWGLETIDNSLRGMPFNYFTQGVACVEVEIDNLTGDSHVVRADINMDVGKSINPALDIGQIEGAFVQGMGWSTTEELIWGDSSHPWVKTGQLFTRGPGTYKIPAFNDAPKDFRIYLSDTDNKYCVHSSKAVGEPPFFLGAATYFAIQNAIQSYRKKAGIENPFYLIAHPATSERIRMGCPDQISDICTASDNKY